MALTIDITDGRHLSNKVSRELLSKNSKVINAANFTVKVI